MKFLKSLVLFALFFYVINVCSMAFQIFVLGQDDYKFGPEGTFQISLMVLGVFVVIATLIYSVCYFIVNRLQKPIQLRQQVIIGLVITCIPFGDFTYQSYKTYQKGNPHSSKVYKQQVEKHRLKAAESEG